MRTLTAINIVIEDELRDLCGLSGSGGSHADGDVVVGDMGEEILGTGVDG